MLMLILEEEEVDNILINLASTKRLCNLPFLSFNEFIRLYSLNFFIATRYLNCMYSSIHLYLYSKILPRVMCRSLYFVWLVVSGINLYLQTL